jgi:Zn-dependent protease
MEQMLTRYEDRNFEYHVQRGFFVPVSAEELERYRAYGCPPDAKPASPAGPDLPPDADGVIVAELADSSGVAGAQAPSTATLAALPTAPASPQLAAVLAEIGRLQQRKSSWGGAVLVLGISLLLFFALGAAHWSWEFVVMLIPILLVHELGHYMAMRLFRYRNVRMFFIPLFGAAVSGQHYNVPGWKKALVSLAGPVPGIGLGLILGLVAIGLRQKPLFDAALLTIVLNGFNLLPFLPLDGGWVAHAILFSRDYVLDVAFRGLAIVALLGAGLLIRDPFLPLLGLFMLFSLPAAYRIARISDTLRSSGLPAASADGQTVPPVTAQAILDQIQRAFPSTLTNRARAQLTLNIFENLNAHPPGLAATLGLAAFHGLSLLAALICAVVLVVAQHANLGNL